MKNSILNKDNLQEEDVLSSSTYELDLDLCGFLTRVPSGTYMKVAFGFPQGYCAKDAGVTFKLYHFKRGNDGKIDPTQTIEIPCVITEYGLVAEINYDNLKDNNILEVAFVANRVDEYEKQNGITNLQQDFSASYNVPTSTSRGFLIVSLSILGGLVVMTTAFLIVVVKKKKIKSKN